jgi:hypothetical protein
MAIQFGKYQLLKKLAAGGMGQVFLARSGQEGYEKLVVLKRILPHLVEDEEFFTMFQDEAKITMRLNHPNIAQIFEFGEERGVHYLTMEYIAGEDVRRLSKRVATANANLPLGVIIRVIADAAAGLDYAHKARDSKGQPLGLVHRDVSPQNVLVGFDGAVKLIDFGVAKAAGRAQHTGTGILKGKFPYMSPEQAEGLEIDARSDVFALGIVLWELLANKRLFKGDSDVMTQRLVKQCQVPAPSLVERGIPTPLDSLVLKALAKKPEDRFPDAMAFRLALEEFAMNTAVPASSAHLVAFLAPFYADRMAAEHDPAQLDELVNQTDLDFANLKSASGVAPAGTGQGGGAQHTAALAQGGKKGKGLWVGLGAAALVGVGAVAYLKSQREPQIEVPPIPHVVTVERTTKVEEPPPPKPIEPVPFDFKVESEPAGAEVEHGGKRLGVTPLAIALAKNELPTILKVSRDGFEPKELTVTDASGPVVSLQLVKKKKSGPAPHIKTNR